MVRKKERNINTDGQEDYPGQVSFGATFPIGSDREERSVLGLIVNFNRHFSLLNALSKQ